MRFEFGRNWQTYLRHSFSEERLAVAGRHLLGFLGRGDLAGSSVLDIGCGSGIHSLAALRAGAARIVSFDFDPQSVAATLSLHTAAGAPPHWRVLQGSVLDRTFVDSLGAFDIVYAWGCLHHTGALAQALDHAAAALSPGGRFYLALYAREHYLDPERWLAVKQRYNRATWAGRSLMEARYVWRTVCRRSVANLIRLPQLCRAYRESRGMAVLTDARDWLGGWPMEFSSVPDIFGFAAGKGLAVIKVKTGEANTEYLLTTGATLAAEGLEPVALDRVAVVRLPVLRTLAQVPEDRPFFLFGTARGARLLLNEARRLGRSPAGFIDIDRSDSFEGLPVHRVDGFVRDFPAGTTVVLSNAYVQENAERLWTHGFTDLINGHPLVVELMMDSATV